MNERIRELALKAFQPINAISSEGVADYYTFQEPWFQLYNQKFSELIVRECMLLADNEASRLYNMNEDDCGSVMENYRELIKQHFGVKE